MRLLEFFAPCFEQHCFSLGTQAHRQFCFNGNDEACIGACITQMQLRLHLDVTRGDLLGEKFFARLLRECIHACGEKR